MGAPFIGRGAVDLGHSGAVNIMEIRVGKIVGRVSGRRWAQVHDFTHETRGRLVVAASLGAKEEKIEVEMVEMGRELLARVHELYFGSLEEDAMVSLKLAVEAIETEFEGVEMVVLVVLGEVLYVVANMGGVWVKAKGKEGWIIRPGAEPGVKGLSSWTKNQETLVFGNSRFWEELPLGMVKAAAENNEIEAAVEMLGAVVHGGDKGEGAAGVVVRLHDEKSEILNPLSADAAHQALQAGKSQINFRLPEIKLPKLKWPKIGWPKAVYVVHGDRQAEKKRTMWVGVGFLAVLLVLVGGWRWSERNKAIKQSFQNRQIEEMVYKFNEAKVLLVLNPIRSRELLKEIEPEMQRFKGTKKMDQRLAAILGEWEGAWNEAMGMKVVEPELVVDLGLVREGMTGAKLEIRDGKLVVLDTQSDRLIEVNPEKKSAEVVAGKDDLGDANLLATYPGKTVVFSDKGIVQCPMLNAQCSIAVKRDDGWGEVVDMGMFAGNIYLLSKGQIWRHQVTDAGYGGRQEWIAKTEDKASLDQSLNMAIDGSVWTSQISNLKSQISKYTRGVKDNFEISGLDHDMGEGAVIYTDEDTLKLYVLDKVNKRVVVLAKTGEYEGQYTAEQLGEGKDLAVDEKTGKIYVTSGSKIWMIKT